MDIDRVRYFHVFAETGSLTKASEVLHLSQPALSKALRTLEDEVGIKLLEPDGRGLRLTEPGKDFRAQTARLLDQWLNLPQRLRQQESERPLRLGSFEVFTTYFLGPLVDQVGLTDLEVHELIPGRLEQAIVDGIVDIGITYAPVPTAGVEFLETGHIRMGVFGRSSVINSEELANLPFVVPILPLAGIPSKVVGLDGWPDHRVARNIRYRVTMMESALELCRRGKAVAYLPEFVVGLHNDQVRPSHRLVECKAPLPLKERQQDVFLLHRKGFAETKILRELAKCLRSLK